MSNKLSIEFSTEPKAPQKPIKIGEIGNGSDQWSVLKNTDTKHVNLILNSETPKEFKEYTTWGDLWKYDSIEDDMVKCTSGKNVKYFNKVDYESAIRDEQNLIFKNKYNPVVNIFNQTGALFKIIKQDDIYFCVKSIRCGYNTINDDSNLSEGLIITEHFIQSGCDLSIGHEFYGEFVFIKYDENANFICRNYNVKLHEYTSDSPNLFDIYKKFEIALRKLGPMLYCDKTKIFYKDECCYRPFIYNEKNKISFTLERINRRQNSNDYTYQNRKGDDIIKRPKKIIEVDSDKIVEMIKNLYLNEILKHFTDFNLENIKEKMLS